MNFLHQEIMFGFTLREIIIALAVIWLLSGVIKKWRGEKVSKKLIKKKCRGCNWVGPAGIETKRCPKCRGPIISAE